MVRVQQYQLLSSYQRAPPVNRLFFSAGKERPEADHELRSPEEDGHELAQ
jgi:hypothetical protein